MGVTEIVTAAVQPANKLIDAVAGAIGKAYKAKTRKWDEDYCCYTRSRRLSGRKD